MDNIKSIVRPVITLLAMITGCYIAISKTDTTGVVPEWFITSFVMILSFWFASRNNDNNLK